LTPRIKYVLEHVEEVLNSYEGPLVDLEHDALKEAIGLDEPVTE
jgi:hypothetical protein